jgi:hypothetical protein
METTACGNWIEWRFPQAETIGTTRHETAWFSKSSGHFRNCLAGQPHTFLDNFAQDVAYPFPRTLRKNSLKKTT